MLLRFAGLNTIQHYHQDDVGFGLSAIIVLKCHKKYRFYCFRGSQELSYNDGIKEGLCLSKDDLVTIEAKEGDIIVFVSDLIHGGGQASLPLKENEILKQSELSDVSVSFDFSHSGMPKGTTKGFAITKAWPRDKFSNEGEEGLGIYRFKGQSPCFAGKIAEATSEFFVKSKAQTVRSKRRRCIK